jgi:hypothetical protein
MRIGNKAGVNSNRVISLSPSPEGGLPSILVKQSSVVLGKRMPNALVGNDRRETVRG